MTVKIAFFCSGGMSSSLEGKRLQEVYSKAEKDINVEAYDFGMMDDVADDADVIILAPQISWSYDDVVKKYPQKKIIKLSISEFGSMNGQIIADRLEKEGIN